MARFSILDNRYDGLSANEAIRQVERDNLLYEQTEAIKRLSIQDSSSIEYKNDIGNTSLIIFITFVFGGFICLLTMIANREYKLNLGILPIIIYVIMLLASILYKILYTIKYNQSVRKQNIKSTDIRNRFNNIQKEKVLQLEKVKMLTDELKSAIVNLEGEKEIKLKEVLLKEQKKLDNLVNEELELLTKLKE